MLGDLTVTFPDLFRSAIFWLTLQPFWVLTSLFAFYLAHLGVLLVKSPLQIRWLGCQGLRSVMAFSSLMTLP